MNSHQIMLLQDGCDNIARQMTDVHYDQSYDTEEYHRWSNWRNELSKLRMDAGQHERREEGSPII